ncbi:Gfo/Idh/MocA family protein [Singulisphaera sp. PoT]|uniref:Gfo/Idh/MocA family protein n=1 Tax=Singulisphaera sp. PoT TaxID=3411797 RepID=UPI003BF59F45
MSRHVRLRVGVIGLGRLWEARHKPALLRMRDQFHITAVYDQVLRRAEIEAAQLGCVAVEGVTALIKRSDVDVVYLLTPQWFGLHPIEIACQFGKPVYCALPLANDLDDLERYTSLIRSSGIPFMPEFARRFYPATLRLRELLATTLGSPRLILGHNRLFGFDRYGQPGPTTQIAPAPLMIDPGSYLLDWCCFLLQSQPTSVQGFANTAMVDSGERGGGPDFESFNADFSDGTLVQISYGRYHRAAWGEASRFLPQPGFQVFAERGAAWLEPPERIQWSDAQGAHEEKLPLEPTVGEVLSDQFHRLVRGGQSLAPTIDDALAIAYRVNDLRRSQVEGRKILCS